MAFPPEEKTFFKVIYHFTSLLVTAAQSSGIMSKGGIALFSGMRRASGK
jgi:hypothetical protein